MEYTYRLLDADYVLHRDGVPIGERLQEVAIGFDKQDFVLHKHGSKSSVQAWIEKTKKSLTEKGCEDYAAQLAMLVGPFPIDDLNRVLDTSGYLDHFMKKHLSALT